MPVIGAADAWLYGSARLHLKLDHAIERFKDGGEFWASWTLQPCGRRYAPTNPAEISESYVRLTTENLRVLFTSRNFF